jgi:hypothetical protein
MMLESIEICMMLESMRDIVYRDAHEVNVYG